MKKIVQVLTIIRSAMAKAVSPLSVASVAVGVVSIAAMAPTANAAIVKLYASVPGYGEVLVLKGSQTGGRVVRHPDGYLYTDRVQRGELLTIKATPNLRAGESAGDFCEIYYDKKGDPGIKYFFWKEGVLPLKHTFRVPMDPGFSGMFTYAETCKEWSPEIDIPIGTR